jgi:hypothetical protein
MLTGVSSPGVSKEERKMNEAMEKAFEEWWANQPYESWVREGARKAWHVRDAEVAELREQLRHSARMLPTQKRPDLEFPPEYYEPDDDPLTMPVERLRECVAVEVMGWRQVDGGWCIDLGNGPTWIGTEFCPDTDPGQWHGVMDKIHGRGWQYFVAPFPSMTEPPTNSTILLAPIWRYKVGFVNWGGREVAIEAQSIEKAKEAACRAALLAVRVRE